MKRYTLSSSPLCEQKRKIRIQKIRQAKSLTENYIHESDETILNKLLDLDELDNAGTVFLYHSVGREVSTTELIERLLKSGKRVALPVSGDDGVMEFYPLSSLSELADGATIGVPNDTSNEYRALALLQQLGLITLNPDAGVSAGKVDIIDNPKNLKIEEIEAAQLPRMLQDFDLAVINGNYALDAGLSLLTGAAQRFPFPQLKIRTEF